ncbi:ABC transporter ATP-binding protein [Patescibacteria group bacterium]|nr:MAG: ABC transporter ATP-binding protein [Patescibacteria group bacterium]
MTRDVLLRLEHATVAYDKLPILEDVSVALDEGEIVALMGPNGAGKSTVLKTIFGMTRLLEGTVRWHDAPFHPLPHRAVRMGIAFVPQGRRVFPSLSVEENLAIGAFTVDDRQEAHRRMEEVMGSFPVLRQKRHDPSGTLSGGQQQMLAIARGLMADPKVLLLDEPSLGLSPKLVKEVFAMIQEINIRHKTAIMVVEHNLKSLFDIVDRAYLLDRGRVVAHGDPGEIRKSGMLEKIFMGKG